MEMVRYAAGVVTAICKSQWGSGCTGVLGSSSVKDSVPIHLFPKFFFVSSEPTVCAVSASQAFRKSVIETHGE